MSWIKRNLIFVIVSVLLLVMMGGAGWFAYQKWSENNQVVSSLNTLYEDLKNLKSKKPHPGDAKVDNVKLAREQQLQVSNYIATTYAYFQPIARIPSPEEAPKITDRDFTTALSRTIDQLQKEAASASVSVVCTNFSFEAERTRVTFDSKGLLPLSVQLGEVKTLVEILFQSRVNSLDNIRRERVAPEDSQGGLLTDYLTEKTTTNEMAVLTPYEVVFKCFSGELAGVLSGLASSSNAFLIKSINVEGSPIPLAAENPNPTIMTTIIQPSGTQTPAGDSEARMRQRYGGGGGAGNRYGGGGGGGVPSGGIEYRGLPSQQQTYVPPVQPANITQPPRSGPLPTVLDERQLKVTINLVLIKMLPPTAKAK